MSERDDDELLDFLDRADKRPDAFDPTPRLFSNFGESSVKGAARGVTRAAFLTRAGSAIIGDRLRGDGHELGDTVFGEMESAVDALTPDPATTGTASQISGGLLEFLAPLALSGGNPGVAAAGTAGVAFTGPTTDLIRQGVDTKTAVGVGSIYAGATLVGFRIPFWGSTLGVRMASGVAGNIAVDVPAEFGAAGLLQAQGYEDQAQGYGPTWESTAMAALMGAGFGGYSHYANGRAVTQADQDAILTANNANHFANETMPGRPTTPEAVTQHQVDLETSIRQVLNGERVNVQGDLSGFELRPELQLRPQAEPTVSATFDHAVDDVLRTEGGYVNDPVDRGGETNFGISARANPDIDVANLTRDQAKEIYRQRYWEPIKADNLPEDVRHIAFDSAVNHGVGWTRRALAEAGNDPARLLELREAHYRGIVAADPSQAKFLRGWLNRIDRLRGEPRPAYTADAAPRLEGETDKAYAKRVIDRLPEPDAARMPDDPALYFQTEGADLVPLRRLVSSKTDAENAKGGATGLKRMAAAGEGALSKRGPVEALRNIDGTFTVTDGNGTLTAARAAGFERLPVRVVGEQPIAQQLAREAPQLDEAARDALAGAYKIASDRKPEFDAALREVDGEVGGTFTALVPEVLKSAKRAAEKVEKYKGDVGRLKDLVRATIVVDSPADVPRALGAIGQRFKVLEVDNSLDPAGPPKDASGYRDVNIAVDLDGVRGEIQISVPEMLVAKQGEGHQLYEQKRVVAERVFNEGRDPNPAEIAELERLDAAMSAVYSTAWAASTAARNSDSLTGLARSNSAMLNLRGGDSSQARQTYPGAIDSGMPSSTANRVPEGNSGTSFIASTSDASIPKSALSRGEGAQSDGQPARPNPPPEGSAAADAGSAARPAEAGARGAGEAKELDPSRFPVQGIETAVVTERGLRLRVRYAVSDVAELVTSHDDALNVNPEFPADLQPRDRARAASAQQITRIANNLNPALLAESPKAADGAPIVGADAVVESGNARTIAVRRAYATGKADAYREFLVDEAERFGLDPSAIAGVEQPMLVRVALDDARDRAEFARQANEQTVAGMSATEQALADARNLPDMAALVTNDDGTINMRASGRFVQGFIEQAVGPNERATMATAAGDLSQQGQTRIRSAVFARAYGDPDLVAMMAEATDANVKNVLAGMLRAAPNIARLREMIAEGGRYGPDLAPDLVMAVRKFSQLRSEGTTVEAYEAQGSFFGDTDLTPKARDLLRTVSENARAPKRMAEFLQRYVDAVDALGDPRQADVFAAAKDGDSAVTRAAEATREANEPSTMRPGADMFGVGRRQAAETGPAITPDNRAAYEAIAAMPDLQVVGEDGVVRRADEFLAESEADAARADQDARAVAAAADCFTRVAA